VLLKVGTPSKVRGVHLGGTASEVQEVCENLRGRGGVGCGAIGIENIGVVVSKTEP